MTALINKPAYVLYAAKICVCVCASAKNYIYMRMRLSVCVCLIRGSALLLFFFLSSPPFLSHVLMCECVQHDNLSVYVVGWGTRAGGGA